LRILSRPIVNHSIRIQTKHQKYKNTTAYFF